MATHSSILAMDKGAWRATVHGVAKSWMWLQCTHTQGEARRRIFCSSHQTVIRFDIRKRCACFFCVILESLARRLRRRMGRYKDAGTDMVGSYLTKWGSK